MRLKKLLNRPEEITHKRLRSACGKWGATVFAKIRVADVLHIDGSGISDPDYGFALKAHFDFVVANSSADPLFAVEYDGAYHSSDHQQSRDIRKNRLCSLADFPILRINAQYLPKDYEGMDVLSWIVETWFFEAAFRDAQQEGTVPLNEPFDPFIWFSTDGGEDHPYWISRKSLLRMQALYDEGRLAASAPGLGVYLDSSETFRGYAFMPVDECSAVSVTCGMRRQQFQGRLSSLLDEIMIVDLCKKIERVLKGEARLEPLAAINVLVDRYDQNYRLLHAASCGCGKAS